MQSRMEYLCKKGRATQSFLNHSGTPSVINVSYPKDMRSSWTRPNLPGQALEWTKLERECCPFLEMQVRWDIENGPVWLDLKGAEGVKDFILDEFALR
jgi:hypothetical protein